MIKWISTAFGIVSVSMIAFLVYHATAGGGGTTSWILAIVWLLGTVLIVGSVLRAIQR